MTSLDDAERALHRIMEGEFADTNDPDSENNKSSKDAIDCIEDLVVSFLSQLSRPTRGCGEDADSDDANSIDEQSDSEGSIRASVVQLQMADRTKTVVYGTPGVKYLRYPLKRNHGSSRPFAQLFRVLDLTHEAVFDDVPCTKRDIYYKDVALFKNQRVVDCLVDDLAATFDLERADLNIRATSKGLVCGSALVVHLLSGETVRATDTEGALIPVGEDIQSFSINEDLSWVLIVEKDAVFHTLCRLGLTNHPAFSGPGIMITGKGYPDMATRHLVKTLSDYLPRSIPIVALVDGDPYGIDILSVYKYGSRSLQHENAKLAARRIKWLGLWASELADFGIDRDLMLPITKHDEKKALAMLRRPETNMPRQWRFVWLPFLKPSIAFTSHITTARKELMYMLHIRRKAEIEILSTAKTPASTIEAMVQGVSSRGMDTPSTRNESSQSGSSTSSLSPSPSGSPFFARSASSMPLSTPPSSQASFSWNPSPGQTSPLLRYLIQKITSSVIAAQARAQTSSS